MRYEAGTGVEVAVGSGVGVGGIGVGVAVGGTGVGGWIGFVRALGRYRLTLLEHFDQVDLSGASNKTGRYSMRDVPRFARPDAAEWELSMAAFPLLLLVLENMALFLGGYLVFMRSEVIPLPE